MSNTIKTLNPLLITTAAIGLSVAIAPMALAQTSDMDNDYNAMTMSTDMNVESTTDFTPPELIKQNIGDLENGETITGAIEKSHTMGDFELALEKTNHDETLATDGPYTVFVPRDSAFWQLEGRQYVEWMNSPEASDLDGIVKTHIVKGELMASDITAQLNSAENGKVVLTTLNGDELTVMAQDGMIKIKDATGNIAEVTTADVDQSNGVIHVINTVLEPAS